MHIKVELSIHSLGFQKVLHVFFVRKTQASFVEPVLFQFWVVDWTLHALLLEGHVILLTLWREVLSKMNWLFLKDVSLLNFGGPHHDICAWQFLIIPRQIMIQLR